MFIFTPNFVTISSGKIRIFYQEVGHILLPGPFEINAFHHFYFLDLFFCFSPGHEIKKMSPKLNTLKCLLNTLKGDNKRPISWILKSQKYFSHICPPQLQIQAPSYFGNQENFNYITLLLLLEFYTKLLAPLLLCLHE